MFLSSTFTRCRRSTIDTHKQSNRGGSAQYTRFMVLYICTREFVLNAFTLLCTSLSGIRSTNKTNITHNITEQTYINSYQNQKNKQKNTFREWRWRERPLMIVIFAGKSVSPVLHLPFLCVSIHTLMMLLCSCLCVCFFPHRRYVIVDFCVS